MNSQTPPKDNQPQHHEAVVLVARYTFWSTQTTCVVESTTFKQQSKAEITKF
jgi:hypothetical protein